MKNEKGITRIGLILIIVIILLITAGIVIYINKTKDNRNEEDDKLTESWKENNNATNENAITDDFKINSYSKFNNEIQYGCYINKDDENISLSIKVSDYNLPSCLYNYKDDIRFRITYSEENHEIYDCKVVNYKTGEIIEDISEDNINKLFNIEYGKNILEKEWSDTIKLSELEENVIYKYVANETTQFPEIENDTQSNCIIYIKENDESSYEKKINMYYKVSSSAISFSYNELNKDDSFNIMYKKIEKTDELLKLINQDDIIYLGNYNSGDELSYSFEKYIYNNTEKDITIQIKDTVFGIEESNSVKIEAGKIYGFDWMIDSVIIKY